MPSAREWTAERTVSARRAAELISHAFPQLRGAPVAALSEGWDNTVHVVSGKWVFRFPRRASALPGFQRELVVLPRVAHLLPRPVPVPELVGMDDDPECPWPFTGSRLLPGTDVAEAALSEDARVPAAAGAGAFLRVLHAPATWAAVREGLVAEVPVDPLQRGWPGARMDRTRESLRRLVDDGVWAADVGVAALLAEAARLGAPSGEPVLVHGDLHVRHLLVDGAGDVAGVIDWGDVCLADPAVDLALGYAAFSGSARTAFLAAYGDVDAERELRARALAIRLSALLADYAAGDSRPVLLAEALAGLRRAVA
ncbi:Predicted kinase, aminoglycoside phosphotransferase (APT) family [Modestobacter sp. DSM 44400]|uniref:phosphotransferase n=1 Tax=Modestobacter sp. DSM 44400 TaxID=1550230 RepID=UPI00089893BA|nr:phosphotransferase [Modestobacter sp. DSM 44400]SDY01647.1 Predicted kinase, aminoglycoside phosphotransferase (APT) family [Modestobacter sp. DSM 44400]